MKSTPARVAIGLGANLGDCRASLEFAITRFGAEPGCRLPARSRFVRSEPVGGPPQPDYLNAVVIIETALDPLALLAVARDVERAAGRDRHREVRWGPRVLDVDLLSYGDLIVNNAELRLPHPRALERGFVLQPWADVDPDYPIPGTGLTVAEAWARLAADGHTLGG